MKETSRPSKTSTIYWIHREEFKNITKPALDESLKDIQKILDRLDNPTSLGEARKLRVVKRSL